MELLEAGKEPLWSITYYDPGQLASATVAGVSMSGDVKNTIH